MFRRPPFMKTLAALIVFSVLFSLGCWQLQRLSWKEDLLQKIETQSTSAPVSLPDDLSQIQEYQPVILHGVYLHDHEMLLKPRVENGKAGYHVVTPLREQDGRIVLVNRGFADDKSLTTFPRPATPATVTGNVTVAHKNIFTPDNRPDQNEWYWADVPAMTKQFRNAAPVLITEGATVTKTIPNDHRQYAIFWFSMSVILLVVFFLSERKPRHG